MSQEWLVLLKAAGAKIEVKFCVIDPPLSRMQQQVEMVSKKQGSPRHHASLTRPFDGQRDATGQRHLRVVAQKLAGF